MKKCGIYEIRNLVDNKVYIGSSINIELRWKRHKRELKANKHTSKHLQYAWNTYGEDNFKFSVIEEIDEDHENFKEYLLEREQFYLDKYDVCNSDMGYNTCTHAGSPLGYKHTPEAIERMKHTPRLKGPLHPSYGTKHTEEFKRYLSEKEKGKGNPMYGKHHSKETRNRISVYLREGDKMLGNNNPMYGKHHSDETKKKNK